MEDRNESNHELPGPDIFSAVNHYFLLFFSISCIIGSFFLHELFFYLKQPRIGISLAPLIGILLPIFLLTYKFPAGIAQQLRISRPSAAMSVFVILSAMLAVVVVDHIYMATQQIIPAPEGYLDGIKQLRPTDPLAIVITFIGLCVIVPIAEEVVFRGMVQQIFSFNMNPVLSFVLAGIFFGVLHLSPHLLISIAFFGVFLGFLFYATANLIYPIVAHAVFNMVAFLQLTLTPEDEISEPPFYVEDIWGLIVAGVLLAFLLRKISKGGSRTQETPSGKSSDIE